MIENESHELSERQVALTNAQAVRTNLEKFERLKILEVYFSRLDGRTPDVIPPSYQDLYSVELKDIKDFLLGQYPQDPLLQKVLRIIN